MIQGVQSKMSSYAQPWGVAGGWAIDLHLGRQHRPHKDVDIAVLRRDQLELHATFSGWSFHKVVNSVREPWLPGETLELPVHEVHATRADEHMEFLLNETAGESWLFRRNPSISMPLERALRCTPEGIPYLCPEIVLLYKAKARRQTDEQDFDHVCRSLDPDAKEWLAAALRVCHPGHEWTTRLEF